MRIAQLQNALEVGGESKGSISPESLVNESNDFKETEATQSESRLFSQSILIPVLGGLAVIGIMSGVGYYVFKKARLKPRRDVDISQQQMDNGPAIEDDDSNNVIIQPVIESDESDRGAPLSRFMTTYLLGDDLYDDSFGI
ncbi:MAG: hypothetical protein QF535_10480, partial [Anaerolineales bacterium]|nr:hypothetical protein [Anaerolineales bacterium]